jgi:hypothetical protein
MKTIFLDIETVFTGCDTWTARPEIDESLDMLEALIEELNNVWIVACHREPYPLYLTEIQNRFKREGFKYPHRIFDQIRTVSPLQSYWVCQWLRENAVENEVNSFCIISAYNIDGLMENFTKVTERFSEEDGQEIFTNWKRNEYRLAKIWHLIDAKKLR